MWRVSAALVGVLALLVAVHGYDAVDAWLRQNPVTMMLSVAVVYLLWDVHVLAERVTELESAARSRRST